MLKVSHFYALYKFTTYWLTYLLCSVCWSNKKLYSVQQCFALLYNQRRTSLDESNTVTDEEDQNSSQSRRTSVGTWTGWPMRSHIGCSFTLLHHFAASEWGTCGVRDLGRIIEEWCDTADFSHISVSESVAYCHDGRWPSGRRGDTRKSVGFATGREFVGCAGCLGLCLPLTPVELNCLYLQAVKRLQVIINECWQNIYMAL